MAIIETKPQVLEDGDEDVLLGTPADGDYADPTADEPAELPEPEPKAEQKQQSEDDDIPPPLRGKSAAELAKMYAEAQKVIGRQGTELGTLRQTHDQFIRQAIEERRRAQAAQPQPAKEAKKLEDVDFFANPQEAIKQAIENNPEVRRLRDENQRIRMGAEIARRQSSERALNERHPDAGAILADPAFREWVGASPIRQRMLYAANQNYDVALADEVFSTWKALNKPVQEAAQTLAAQSAEKRAKAKTAAKVPSAGSAAPKEGAAGKVYRRADLIRLQVEDPDRYDAMIDEIEKAYIEGRVR